MSQTEIPPGQAVLPDHQKRFVVWLERFSRIPPSFRKTFERFRFSESELLLLKPQIGARYKLKKEVLERESR